MKNKHSSILGLIVFSVLVGGCQCGRSTLVETLNPDDEVRADGGGLLRYCGDGIVTAPEACEPSVEGGSTDPCNSDCTFRAGPKPPDAGLPVDAGTLDAGRADAGVADSGHADAGFDAGQPPLVCPSDQHAEMGVCVSNTRVGNCQPTPVNAISNTTDTLDQVWAVDAGRWEPPGTRVYDVTPSTTECRFYCSMNFPWNGQACATDRPSHCFDETVNGVTTTSWYYLDAGMKGALREQCQDVPRGLNCSDREGCCSPGGVSINGHCVTYQDEGAYCYASPACKQPMSCNSNHTCVP